MNKKTIPIRFQPEQQLNVTEAGESGTVTLECRLPPDFRHVTHGSVTFIIGTQASEPYTFPGDSNYIDFTGGKLLITIWPALTARRFLRLIVTGHAPGGKQVVTPLSELLRFSRGETPCVSCGPLSAIEELRRQNEDLQEQLDILLADMNGVKAEMAATAEVLSPTAQP